MKVSFNWLREFVDLNISNEELTKLLPLRTIGVKEVTQDFVELDMKGYNRADLLSLRGVAYEVAAITGSKLKFIEIDISGDKIMLEHKDILEFRTKVEDPQRAPLYTLVKIEGLRVGKSTESWIKKLKDSGIRSINNIADVTNLVMVEYGQPMHAFDGDKIDEEIVVRIANKGERIKTLDGKERVLSSEDLLITDPQRAVGIAGVMGGENSEVTDSTTTIFLEAAIFDSQTIRKTSTRLGLVSEASKRFVHGLTQRRLFQALDAAIKMYEDLGGKLKAITMEGTTFDPIKRIPLTLEKVRSLIGVEISPKDTENYLKKLNFKLQRRGVNVNHPEGVIDNWEIIPPYFRLDIEIEEDVVEEVARMYGYEKIPSQELKGSLPSKIDQTQFELISKLKKTLVDLGLTEVQTYSFYSTDVLRNLGWMDHLDKLIKVANPISSETEFLRQNIWSNLLEVAAKNSKRGFRDIVIFEVGKIYWINQEGEYNEKYSLAILLVNNTDNPIQELYNIFQGVKLSHLRGVSMLKMDRQANFHPTRFAFLQKNDKTTGFLAELHPRVVNKFGVEQRVAALEIDINL